MPSQEATEVITPSVRYGATAPGLLRRGVPLSRWFAHREAECGGRDAGLRSPGATGRGEGPEGALCTPPPLLVPSLSVTRHAGHLPLRESQSDLGAHLAPSPALSQGQGVAVVVAETPQAPVRMNRLDLNVCQIPPLAHLLQDTATLETLPESQPREVGTRAETQLAGLQWKSQWLCVLSSISAEEGSLPLSLPLCGAPCPP